MIIVFKLIFYKYLEKFNESTYIIKKNVFYENYVIRLGEFNFFSHFLKMPFSVRVLRDQISLLDTPT